MILISLIDSHLLAYLSNKLCELIKVTPASTKAIPVVNEGEVSIHTAPSFDKGTNRCVSWKAGLDSVTITMVLVRLPLLPPPALFLGFLMEEGEALSRTIFLARLSKTELILPFIASMAALNAIHSSSVAGIRGPSKRR